MKHTLRNLFLIIFSLFLFGCAKEQFCSLNCAAPTETPVVNQEKIDTFAKQDVKLMPKGDYLRIVLPADRFFQPGLPALNLNKRAALDQVALLLQSYGKTATVEIKGYTDPIASNEANKALSLARARSVQMYLWSKGLDPDHLYAIGCGSQYLVADPNVVSANAANRRVEIIVHARCTTCF